MEQFRENDHQEDASHFNTVGSVFYIASRCTVCGSDQDLWICLICGNVGCGRYTSEHAQEHYLETQHNFAMALNDNRVWDYHGDYFVHRLIQNESSRKIIGPGAHEMI